MTVAIQEQGEAKIVRVHGELVGEEVDDFVQEVTNLLTGSGVRIVIDLVDVPFINSMGLSALVRVTAQANIQEGQVILVQPSPFVEGVLQTSQLDRFFDIAPSIKDALRLCHCS